MTTESTPLTPEWISVAEAIRAIMRRWPSLTPVHAAENLVKAILADKIAARGRRYPHLALGPIPFGDWLECPLRLAKSILTEPGRKIPRVIEIETRAADIEREFAAAAVDRLQDEATERPKNKGGAPPIVDWEVVKIEFFRLMDYHGDFGADDPEWNAQARLEEALEVVCESKFKKRPGRTTIQGHIRPWLHEWREQKQQSTET